MAGHGLQHGLYMPAFGPLSDPDVLVNLAVRAEAAGWDGVFLWDHVAPDEGFGIADPWTCLAAMAQATQRIRLGTMVTPLARRRPWVVARQAATLSRLSGGRFLMGVGLGADEFGDFSRFGEATRPAVRAAKLDEGLAVMRAIWSGQPVDHHGEHYQVTLDGSEPVPYPIPVWAGSSADGVPSSPVVRRAARCDGIYPNPGDRQLAPADIAGLLESLRAAGLTGGRPFDVAIRRHVDEPWLRKWPAVDLAALAEAGLTWWMEGLIHYDELEFSMGIVDKGPPDA